MMYITGIHTNEYTGIPLSNHGQIKDHSSFSITI
jgi:hypothetical protein